MHVLPNDDDGAIRVAIAGLGNCASALIEGLAFYSGGDEDGLLFPILGGFSLRDIEIVGAFDIARGKVGLAIDQAIYQPPNDFVRIPGLRVVAEANVFRGPTLDGNPEHLAGLVTESELPAADVAEVLKGLRAEVLLNLLPTGSLAATEHYAGAALEAGCAFINAIPTPLAQRAEWQARFAARGLPLLGDDIKSQMGTTILHRALLSLLHLRGARLQKTSQVNIGGNTDFRNFVHRAETKLVSKRKSLKQHLDGAELHVGHHFDPTRGPLKNALIEIVATVFAGSKVRVEVRLESDDKPNCAGSLVDLIRIAHAARVVGLGGTIEEACAFYMKSPPVEMDDADAAAAVLSRWVTPAEREVNRAGTVDSSPA